MALLYFFCMQALFSPLIGRVVFVYSGGFFPVWGDAYIAMMGQIAFCTCASQPDDNSSSDRSLVRLLFFVTHSEDSIFALPRSRQSVFLPSWPHRSLANVHHTTSSSTSYIKAPKVISTPACLQANVIARRDHLQRLAARISSRSTTSDDDIIRKCVTSVGGTFLLILALSAWYRIFLSLKVPHVGTCISGTLSSEARTGHTQREWWLRKISLRSFGMHIARRLHSLPVVDRTSLGVWPMGCVLR